MLPRIPLLASSFRLLPSLFTAGNDDHYEFVGDKMLLRGCGKWFVFFKALGPVQ